MDSLPPDSKILAVDVGGTGIKAALLDSGGQMLTERIKVATPLPITPELLVQTIADLVAPLGEYAAVSVGFPGVVRRGKILTAPNLGTDVLHGFDLAGTLGEKLARPVRVANDADVQGLAVIRGHGVELVITLGTGMGFANFLEGRLGAHFEMSHHLFRQGETYEEQIGNAALKKIGAEKWNRRVQRVIKSFRALLSFDRLYIGGGNARKIDFALDADIEIVNNENGIKGGAWLWRDGGLRE